MKKILLFILLGSISLAQEKENKIIVQDYPKNQQFYIDGEVQFYKELHQVFIDKKLKPCDNKNELYTAWIVINPDASIVIPEEKDVEDINEIRCTYNLVRESFKYLNKWQPATIDGKNIVAGTFISIYPNALFDNYNEGYDINNFMSNAYFNDGMGEFRESFVKNLNFKNLRIGNIKKVVINFIVTDKGNIEDIHLEKSSGNKKFDTMIINSIKMINGNWTPAKMHGIPVNSLPFIFPVNLNNN
ncbi:energy transducer TonB [Elizabethkingia sp. M8]|uniref:energy transducer TonB n=1 Tax=Elizabethkingia sp. M8 TaxID=2796140 RepID=UPI001908703B|nr:TonB C-terminal domain-containing protein [Elizabethkingia sp. M8]QQM25819.1 TonB C-terminal domain-containing protein [Elizabethkingia sp. M8]